MLPDAFQPTSITSSSRLHRSLHLHIDRSTPHHRPFWRQASNLARQRFTFWSSKHSDAKMVSLQQLTPARSQSSAGRSDLGSDGDSATTAASYKMHRQERRAPPKKRLSPRATVAVLAVLVFITQFGASLSDVPSVRLLQEVICRREYGLAPGSSVQEDKCRTDGIQGQLNVISTGALIFGYLPGEYRLPHCICSVGEIRSRLNISR